MPIPALIDRKPTSIRNVRTLKFSALKCEHKLIIDPIYVYRRKKGSRPWQLETKQ